MPFVPSKESNNSQRTNKKEDLDTGCTLVESISLPALFANAVEPNLFLSLEGAIWDINPSGKLYLGITNEQFPLLTIFDFLFPEDAVLLQEVMEDILETKVGVLDVRLKLPDVGALAVELVYQVVDSKVGPLIYVRIHDRQDKHFLRRLLEEKEVSINGAERLAKIGTWTFFPKEGRIIWSEEIFNIFGIEDRQTAPSFEQYLKLVHPDDVDAFSKVVQEAIEQYKSYFIKHRIIRADGSTRWVMGRGDASVDENGVLEKIFGTVQDITEEEKIREAMRKSEQRIRFHIDRSPLGYIEWNPRFEVVEWNRAAESIFGFTREEALMGEAHIIPESEAERIHSVVHKLMNDIGGTHSVNKNQTKSGRIITVEWFNTTLIGENGDILGIGSIVQDITDRIEARERLENYAFDLEKARDEAERAASAKSEFLANMSHEIRTPMNGVIGMASILLETDLDEEQQDYVETIVSSGESLMSIINDILDFSKIDAGKIDFEFLPFDAREVVENTFDLLAAKATEKRLELIHFVSPNVPDQMIGDPTRIQQILLNLLGNALKFTEEGHIELRVEMDSAHSSSRRLIFHVEDTGIGIPEDKLDRLFRAFSQVDASTSRKYGGTGLGLSISAQLSKLMGGDISVESREGRGSTFTFSVQVETSARQNKHAEKAEGLHVLLAQPHLRMRDMLITFLQDLNCTWVWAATKEEVCDLIKQDSEFDVILVEGDLDDGFGYEFTQQLIAMEMLSAHIIVLSWRVDRSDQFGKVLQLAKPIHLKNLNRALKKLSALQK